MPSSPRTSSFPVPPSRRIYSRIASQSVIARKALRLVVASAREQFVVAVLAPEEVVTVRSDQHVRARASKEEVAISLAGSGCKPTRLHPVDADPPCPGAWMRSRMASIRWMQTHPA